MEGTKVVKGVAILLLVSLCFAGQGCAADHPDVSAVTTGNTAFACDLYARLRTQPGNLFFSPYSISAALAMTYGGARGETAAQMAHVLHFDLPQDELHPVFAALEADLATVQKNGKVELRVANSLWPQKGHRLLPVFLSLCKRHYDTTITQLDYVTAAEPARQTINTWVEDKTNNKITDLIAPDVLSALTRLVLVNAVYFKGDWASQFDAKQTAKKPFHVSAAQTVETPLMQQKKEFRYAEVDGLQLLQLPYAGDDLSMIVLLPRRADGLAAIELQLTPQNLAAWTAALHPCDVAVFLPKFQMTSQFSLEDKLAALGMADAFDEGADFSGMDGRRDLFISAVIHKAFVDVNEEGTEAAAATAVVITRSVSMQPAFTPVFRADHPFLFLIYGNHTGSILFLGRVIDPTK